MMLDFFPGFDLVGLSKYNVLDKLVVLIYFVNIKLRMQTKTSSTSEQSVH